MSEIDELAAKVVRTFTERSISLATSESLTGGLLGAAITTIPGSSKIYLGGAIVYATAMKAKLSGVPMEILRTYGVVSEQTVTEMAVGIQRLTGADWAAAASGVAGPDPQEGHLPGEVWICVAGPKMTTVPQVLQSHRYVFEGDRAAIRQRTVITTLQSLLTVISPV